MITNFIIPPHASLLPFVDYYILSTSEGKRISLESTWPASNEMSLVFYLSDQPYHYSNEHQATPPLKYKQGCIVGLLPHCNGRVSFKGVYQTFIVHFKANGFNKLFRMPVQSFVNNIYYLDEVFGGQAKEINEGLQHAPDVESMACTTDTFLLRFLNHQMKHASLYDGITYISSELFNKAPLLSVDQYALRANMSVRNFSRRFNEQTGVSPKFYCRLLRFNHAVTTRLKDPQSNWTSIAHECGYFDQMHMIKDFKQFANANPSSFFQPRTDYNGSSIDLTSAGQKSYTELPVNLADEKFVYVKRNDM